ncbi:MAG: alkaline phosphatase D family protein [Pirellulaceae bacterium]
MIGRILSFSCLLLCIPTVALAQHDPQRNTVQHIAAERFDKATAELAKGDQTEPETHFVRMMQSLAEGKTDEAVRHAQSALDAGLPFERLVAGPRDLLAPLYAADEYKKWLEKYGDTPLLHGPMLGAVADDGASFWVRTARPATVRIEVFESDKPSDKPVAVSEPTRSTADSDYTAVARVTGLKAATAYRYHVLIDGKRIDAENTDFRTFPTKGQGADFQIGFGGGAGYVPMWEYMWDTLVKVRPLAFFMLGDNVYIDDPTHPLTQNYCYYRRQSRPEWRRFIASTAMYSIYDDHDFGTNDCVPGPEIDKPAWKRDVWRRYTRNWVNPSYGGGEEQPGCWYDFYIGDVHFILLDGRYYRSRGETPSMLGPVQKAWLKETLAASRGTFKVLASPVPWTAGIKPGSRDPWDGFPEEREEIFSFLEEKKIDGVILMAADRHRSDLRITARPAGYHLYEFESSRLTNRHTHGVVKTPGLVWGYNKTCSCGLIRFNTTADDPTVTFEVMTIDGERILEHTLPLSKLRHARD